MIKNTTYCDKHVSSRKCIFFVVWTLEKEVFNRFVLITKTTPGVTNPILFHQIIFGQDDFFMDEPHKDLEAE